MNAPAATAPVLQLSFFRDPRLPGSSGHASTVEGKRLHACITLNTAWAGLVVPRLAPQRVGVRRMVSTNPQPDPLIGASPLNGLGRLSSLGNDIGEGKSKAARQFAIVHTTNPFTQQLL
jgi:hypothetical protein